MKPLVSKVDSFVVGYRIGGIFGVFPMRVKDQVVVKGVDRSEVVPALMSSASHRTDCTLRRKLGERESKNRPSAAVQVVYRLGRRALATILIQQNDV